MLPRNSLNDSESEPKQDRIQRSEVKVNIDQRISAFSTLENCFHYPPSTAKRSEVPACRGSLITVYCSLFTFFSATLQLFPSLLRSQFHVVEDTSLNIVECDGQVSSFIYQRSAKVHPLLRFLVSFYRIYCLRTVEE